MATENKPADADTVREAREVLQRVLDAIKDAELDASQIQIGALIGALETLRALQQTTD